MKRNSIKQTVNLRDWYVFHFTKSYHSVVQDDSHGIYTQGHRHSQRVNHYTATELTSSASNEIADNTLGVDRYGFSAGF